MELAEYEGYNTTNWDGYGAEPVTPETLAFARTIAELLKSAPDAAPGGDGSVCFEWVNGPNKIFFDVRGTDVSMFARINGVFLAAPTRS
jgi:hypothetical protein